MNRRAKSDAASFTLGGEIRNRTNSTRKNKQKTQTVTDIFTPCLSACVDNKWHKMWRKTNRGYSNTSTLRNSTPSARITAGGLGDSPTAVVDPM